MAYEWQKQFPIVTFIRFGNVVTAELYKRDGQPVMDFIDPETGEIFEHDPILVAAILNHLKS
jgi:hypothetical protein